MDIFLTTLVFLVGLFVLIKGADFLVDGASGVARKLKISELVIGMTIIVFGTSAPEIFVALKAFSSGETDLILGDIIGCAIADIFLLLGVSALIRPVKIRKSAVEVEMPFYVFLITVFVALVAIAFFTDGEINRTGAVVLLLLYFTSLFLTFFISKIRSRNSKTKTKPARTRRKKIKKERKTWVYVLFLFGGLAAVVLGSDLVVNNAKTIASAIGVSERVIAIAVVAIGTSLPELTAAIFASKKGEQDLLIGNSLGSNIFDICVVLGLPILIYGGISIVNFNILDLVMMASAALILFMFTKEDKYISRKEGAVMVGIFVAYYVITFIWT